jgi:hypothetical protein
MALAALGQIAIGFDRQLQSDAIKSTKTRPRPFSDIHCAGMIAAKLPFARGISRTARACT